MDTAKGISLDELEARISGGHLVFLCPNCRDHAIRVPMSPRVNQNTGLSWAHLGELESGNLSLFPSVDAGCWHGNISEGRAFKCE